MRLTGAAGLEALTISRIPAKIFRPDAPGHCMAPSQLTRSGACR